MHDDDDHQHPHDASGRTTLVSNGPFRVERCPCGTVHLTIGAVTVRLPPAALEPLTDTLMRAADRLPLPTAATTH